MPRRYPEHARLREVAEKTQHAGEFLSWLRDEAGFEIYDEAGDLFLGPAEELLARWQGIDRKALETEKQHMLDSLREGGGRRPQGIDPTPSDG